MSDLIENLPAYRAAILSYLDEMGVEDAEGLVGVFERATRERIAQAIKETRLQAEGQPTASAYAVGFYNQGQVAGLFLAESIARYGGTS